MDSGVRPARRAHAHEGRARLRSGRRSPRSVQRHTLDFECPPLGQGSIDWLALAGALAEVGYDGYLSAEYSAHLSRYQGEPWDRFAVAAECHRFIDDLLKPASLD